MVLFSYFANISAGRLALLTVAVAATCTASVRDTDTGRFNALEKWTHRADALLKTVVVPPGLVSYDRAMTRKTELKQLVERVGRRWTFENDDQKLALHINAYNLIVIQSVIDHWPVTSVTDVQGFFKKMKHRVNGRSLTLNELENEVIRPMGRPRIHAALVCAAVSCPPLRRGAFTADELEDQLERITRRWINDADKNTARRGTLLLSAIFKWYREDFSARPYRGVDDFVKRHANEGTAIAELLSDDPSPKIRYLDYDWKLNAAPED